MNILYLGLDPKNFSHSGSLLHYPVIRTVCLDRSSIPSLWPSFTHILFTSQTTVTYLSDDLSGKTLLAIGPATADALRRRGGEPIVAPVPTQEGMIELLQSLDLTQSYLFFPHSRLARPLLTNYLCSRSLRFFALPLYDTLFQKLEPVPDLAEIDEIVFTSPSTVEGFLRIYQHLPTGKKLTAIGPITQEVLSISARRSKCV